jgi:hypothetical protein
VRAVPRLCELYPGICLTTEEKHGKTSVRVVEKRIDIPVAVVQYTFTHKQYTEQHSETEYAERNRHNNKNIVTGFKHIAPMFRLRDAVCACEELLCTCQTIRCHKHRTTGITLPTIFSRVRRLATDNHFPDCPLKSASTLNPQLCCCN